MEKKNQNCVDDVIRHIKTLITAGIIEPGKRLPAERKLSEQLNISRAHVREAIKKMEAYGIVKTVPQSGTVVSQLKIQSLESMITDVLTIDQYDFASLAHVRILLEKEGAKLCACNRTDNDLNEIEQALIECEKNFDTENKIQKDFAFHHAIAVGSHNSVIASLLLIITPDVLKYYQRYKMCEVARDVVFKEHRDLFNAIKEKDGVKAVSILTNHFSNLQQFSNQVNKEFVFGEQ